MRTTRLLTVLFALYLALITGVSAQTTEFSYQGFITDNNAPANGVYDLEFRLFDALNGGIALATQPRANVIVTDGVFNVVLDFGGFPAASRFLEIALRLAGGGSLTTLVPRSKILAVPLATNALTAQNAVNAQNAQNSVNAQNAQTAQNALRLGGTLANQFVLGNDVRLNDARIPLPGSGSYIRNGANQQASSSFNISGDGTAGGTLSGTILNSSTHFSIGGVVVLKSPGSFNFFAGTPANNTTGTNNSFFGVFSGSFNTTGSGNAFFGMDAGRNNTTGSDNSYFGRGAGLGAINSTGSNNAFFGKDAGRDNTTGGSNSFFGKGAGLSNTSASNNSFFGTLAGNLNTTGDENAFFGSGAGADNTNGDRNAFFGFASGENNTTGFSNAFFGEGAGAGTTSGSDNTFVGNAAGTTNTTGGSNTAIGNDADVGDVDLTNATAIGARSLVTANHSLVLGSIAGINGAINDTKVGIGTTAPLDRLHVDGIIRVETLGAAGTTSLCRNTSEQISTCSSSLRYKTDIAPFSSGLNLVNRLRPISFTWKEGGMRDLGLGAEDVAAIEPLLATYNEKGEVEGVKYDRLAVVLLNAIKEQQSQIDEQSKQLAAQQARDERQQVEIARLVQELRRLSNQVKRSNKQ
jgi:trimeric autotransporter adhesin